MFYFRVLINISLNENIEKISSFFSLLIDTKWSIDVNFYMCLSVYKWQTFGVVFCFTGFCVHFSGKTDTE